jgi:hypothetical protein
MSFTRFQKLPTELRWKVWRHALLLFPRIVEVRTIWNPLATYHPASHLSTWLIKPNATLNLLCIDRETKEYLLPFYAIRFNADLTWSQAANFRFCPQTDTLFFNLRHVHPPSLSYEDILEQVFDAHNVEIFKSHLQSLAGNNKFWLVVAKNEGVQILSEFQNLEEMILTVKSSRQGVRLDRLIWFEDAIRDPKFHFLKSLVTSLEEWPEEMPSEVRVCLQGCGIAGS